jgi:hypothetical protein
LVWVLTYLLTYFLTYLLDWLQVLVLVGLFDWIGIVEGVLLQLLDCDQDEDCIALHCIALHCIALNESNLSIHSSPKSVDDHEPLDFQRFLLRRALDFGDLKVFLS